MKKSILIVGGGLAGIAAAAALPQETHQITLIERRRFLGGRASAFPVEDGWLDNCQHVVLNCCSKLLDLLNKLGTRQKVTFHSEIPFLQNGKTTILRSSKLPVPFHFLPSFIKAPLFSFNEKLRVLKLFSKLLKLNRNQEILDQTSLFDWLTAQGQTRELIDKFWNIVFISSLNETLERTSAKYGIMVLQETFLAPHDLALMGTPNVSLAELYHESAKNLFEKSNIKILHANARGFELGHENPKVILDDGTILNADILISAVPFYNLLPLLPDAIRKDSFFKRFENLETSPILGIHLWFDRKITDYPFGAFPGSPVHWFFSKPPQKEFHYIQLVISACRPFMDHSTESLVKLGLEELTKYLPSTQGAVLLKSKVVREGRATFSPQAGVDRFRPSCKTPIPGFYLAGDWTATNWPATMEGAVRSGYRAAEALKGQS